MRNETHMITRPRNMQLLLVDIYQDPTVPVLVFDNTAEVKAAIETWKDLDRQYCEGTITEPTWLPINEYMTKQGFAPYETETINL